jgi:protoheme IX farnesyltransferase
MRHESRRLEPHAVALAVEAPAIDAASLAPERRLLADLYSVTKPRMNFLVVVTTVIGFAVAAGSVADLASMPWLLLHTLLGTALTAASASVFNQIIEREYDAKMRRTRNRPLASGRLGTVGALVWGSLLLVAGVAWLVGFVNPITAALGFLTVVLYVLIYTPMKRLSSLCTLVGAIPGAVPPMMGVTAVRNEVDALAWALFAILFVWQMPHFFALAMMYRDDYAAGGFRMLPLIENGIARTRRQILGFSLLLLPVSLTPLLVDSGGVVYGLVASVLGFVFLRYAWPASRGSAGSERKLFLWSIIYLPLLLGALMLGW